MKVVFLGPSLRPSDIDPQRVQIRPPAACGDVLRAVLDEANIIGLVDGSFEQNAAVWHKEILFALQSGVTVFGAASMGALRAAECQAFGMVPIGQIASDYLAGRRIADEDVALTHGPMQVGYSHFSEALIDIEATILNAEQLHGISSDVASKLRAAARNLNFRDRTLSSVASSVSDSRSVFAALKKHWISQKARDAQLLIDAVLAAPDQRMDVSYSWKLRQPLPFRELLGSLTATG